MAWFLLSLAGLFEIGWPFGFKMASIYSKYFYLFIVLAVISMGISGYLLYIAQKSIPIGVAYVVWTGIGAIGTVMIGIFCFQDAVSLLKLLFIAMIVGGIVGLKLVG